MNTYRVTIGKKTWCFDASRAAVAIKYAIDFEQGRRSREGEPSIEAEAKAGQLSVAVSFMHTTKKES